MKETYRISQFRTYENVMRVGGRLGFGVCLWFDFLFGYLGIFYGKIAVYGFQIILLIPNTTHLLSF